ncbi:uncharacterized protein ASCRUDRAFT_7957 [Ascoidea rubescens DSM 1968]|uniref:Uncharacterized protein n=1 Tax=Ascoidea rubescens DSM 1968 TaxID=1344418 RepID=A0A1D2VHK2_9ASCO|nr:hypothetical protein ASCRUDRAFT_7957 [Ascoidea rubescens DSM 1968]ODV60983.1 hypothetical protein ASCRUDRAFT_7957 [Ascoidea rubescens DSM 1968]
MSKVQINNLMYELDFIYEPDLKIDKKSCYGIKLNLPPDKSPILKLSIYDINSNYENITSNFNANSFSIQTNLYTPKSIKSLNTNYINQQNNNYNNTSRKIFNKNEEEDDDTSNETDTDYENDDDEEAEQVYYVKLNNNNNFKNLNSITCRLVDNSYFIIQFNPGLEIIILDSILILEFNLYQKIKTVKFGIPILKTEKITAISMTI